MEDNRKVDYRRVFSEIWKRKKLYCYVLPIVFILSSLYIICIPRTYTSEAEMSLETSSSSSGTMGTLGTLASSFGLDMSSLESSDAITPMLYPDLLQDNGFIASLFTIKVKTADGALDTDYYTYMNKYQESAWWNKLVYKVMSWFVSAPKVNKNHVLDPYHPTQRESDIIKNVRQSLTLKVDKKTGAITVSVVAQDPLVCKLLTDSICNRLQIFITDYRTRKARTDYNYYDKLMKEALAKYTERKDQYASYADTHQDAILEAVNAQEESLRDNMSNAYDLYSTMSKMRDQAQAKIQECTPVFMQIKGAAVPTKATSPKRMVFVLIMTILAFVCTSLYVLRDIILPKSQE